MAGLRDPAEHRPEGLYCPAGDFPVDPWRLVPRAVTTHGSDAHSRSGMGVVLCKAEREVFEGQLEVRALQDLLARLHARRIALRLPKSPTPLAFPLWS